MISPNPQDFQAYKVTAAYIRQLPPGTRLDAVSASLMMMKDWSIRLDWHEFSYTLDNLSRDEHPTVKLTGHNSDGMCQYIIAQ